MAAAKLPHVAIRRVDKVIGKSTVPAMQSGLFWGYVGLIEGLVARIAQEHGAAFTTIATGGLAPLFLGATPVIAHLEPEITIRGLVEIHRRSMAARA
jgi:type III pantothenate kinase